jgi:phosphatidylglycerol:prolipoprotein diacylglycerol transferase
MIPILFRIPVPSFLHSFLGPDQPIYGYGLMLVIGFLGAVQLAKFLAKRSKLNPEIFVNAALIALIAGVVGARLSHVLENLGDYTRADRTFMENFMDAINIRTGGLTYYGGFLLAFPVTAAYALWKKVPLRLGMDIVAPCVMIGLGVGRIGCLLNGCCYGAECKLPWAMSFPYHSIAYIDEYYRDEVKPPAELTKPDPEGGRPRLLTKEEVQASHDAKLIALAKSERSVEVHPAQIYSAITGLMLAALLVAYFTLPHAPGRVFALMLMLEGLTRYMLELLRVEPPVHYFFGYGFSLSMELSIGLIALGVILWIAFGLAARRDGTRIIEGRLVPAT